MNKKVDYSLKFYKGKMLTDNGEQFNFYLSGRSIQDANRSIENHANIHKDRYHIIPEENNIASISIKEVSVEDYGKSYGYEVIN